MHFAIVFRVLGLLLMLFSITLIPPIFVSIYFKDTATLAFIISFAIILLIGLVVWAP